MPKSLLYSCPVLHEISERIFSLVSNISTKSSFLAKSSSVYFQPVTVSSDNENYCLANVVDVLGRSQSTEEEAAIIKRRRGGLDCRKWARRVALHSASTSNGCAMEAMSRGRVKCPSHSWSRHASVLVLCVERAEWDSTITPFAVGPVILRLLLNMSWH